MFTRKFIPLVALPLMLLAGCGSSSSAGMSPSPTSQALAVNHIHSILIAQSNPNQILVGMHYRLFRSMDGGRTLHPVVTQMMLSLAADWKHPGTVYGVSQQQGPSRSRDGGLHWSLVPGLKKGAITGVSVDPSTGVLFGFGLGIRRSIDGVHWSSALTSHSVRSVASGTGGSVYAASDDGLFVSHDGGIHWSSNATVGNQPVIGVAASRKTGYAVGAIGLFKTADGGHTWHQLNTAPQGIEFLTVAPTNPNTIIAEVAQRGFFASNNGGSTWHRANSGIHATNFNASAVRVAPSNPNVMYTAAWGVHFYASRNGGKTWTQTAYVAH